MKKIVFTVLSLVSSAALAATDWDAVAKKVQNAVVIVSSNAVNGFNGEFAGSLVGTGTVIDKERGIVLTNAHVTSTGPLENLKVEFLSYQTVAAKVLYVDPWHDFAFIQFDPKTVTKSEDFALTDVALGAHATLRKKQELLLIGNSSGEGIAYKVGTIDNLLVNKALNPLGRHSHHIKLTLARAGGASGSPIFDENARIVGLHDSGSRSGSESFELRIDYVADAYQRIRAGASPTRGDIGIALGLITHDSAQKNYGYPHPRVADKVITVGMVLPGTATSAALASGDIVIAAKDAQSDGFFELGTSLYDFDRLVDRSAGKTVTLRVYRQNAAPSTFETTLPVTPAPSAVIDRFTRFSGAYFQDVTPFLGLKFDIPLAQGVFMVNAAYGTSLSQLGNSVSEDGRATDNKYVLIKEINRRPVRTLDEFNAAVTALTGPSEITITSCDYNDFSRNAICRAVDIDILSADFAHYTWDPKALRHQKKD